MQVSTAGKHIPPHHDAETFDLLQVDRLGILLRSPSISRIEATPRNEYGLVMGIARHCLWWEFKVAFVRNARLFSSRVGVLRQKFILEIKCVALLCEGLAAYSSHKRMPYYRPWLCTAQCLHSRKDPIHDHHQSSFDLQIQHLRGS